MFEAAKCHTVWTVVSDVIAATDLHSFLRRTVLVLNLQP